MFATGGLQTFRRLCAQRNYALYIGGASPSYISQWVQRLGVGWLTWELTHSTTWLGAVAAADLAPMIFLAPLAGAYTDRGDPWRQFVTMQSLLCAQAVALTLFYYCGALTVEWLFALSLWSGLAYPLHQTSRHALVPRIVSRDDLAPAIVYDSVVFQASRFVGPALGGYAVLYLGVGSTFLVQSIGAGLFVIALLFLRPQKRQARGRATSGILGEIADGFAYVHNHAGILPLFVMLAMACALLRPVQEMLPALAGNVFMTDARGLAWLLGAIGVGALISASRFALRASLKGLTGVSLVGFMLMSLATLGLVATPWLWLGVVAAGLSGYAMNTMSTAIQTMTQATVEDSMRGRVMGLYSLLWRGSPALGTFAGGVVADRIGVRATFTVVAVVCALAGLAVARRHAAIVAAMETQAA